MIKVVYGHKGIGKTKYLIAEVTGKIKDSKGDIVFIDTSNSLMTDLPHEIRYVNISEFPVKALCELVGFICGLIAEDYDIEMIYLDGLEKIENGCPDYEGFFEKIKIIENKYNVSFVFSTNGDIKGIPDDIVKEYSC